MELPGGFENPDQILARDVARSLMRQLGALHGDIGHLSDPVSISAQLADRPVAGELLDAPLDPG
jgi:hypothetical protein